MGLLDALHLLQQGEWAQAHMIAEADDSRLGAWVHAIVHLAERDEANARFWFAEANRPYPGPDALDTEIAALQLVLALQV
jgi:hypothetical protein